MGTFIAIILLTGLGLLLFVFARYHSRMVDKAKQEYDAALDNLSREPEDRTVIEEAREKGLNYYRLTAPPGISAAYQEGAYSPELWRDVDAQVDHDIEDRLVAAKKPHDDRQAA